MEVLGIDQDEQAIEHAKNKAADAANYERLNLWRGKFANLKSAIHDSNLGGFPLNGVLFDLGFCNAQVQYCLIIYSL